MNDFPSFQNSFSKVLQNHLNLRATGWNPQKHLFFQKIIILAITKIISKSSAAWTAVFVYSCGSPLKFSPKDHGRRRSPGSSDMEKSLQSYCGPFWELE
jgi:hypothetical protein